jgi:hypothetical protein
MVGFGYTDRPDHIEHNKDTWVTQVMDLLDALRIPTVDLGGKLVRWRDCARSRDPSPPGEAAGSDGQRRAVVRAHARAGRRMGLHPLSRKYAAAIGYLLPTAATW